MILGLDIALRHTGVCVINEKGKVLYVTTVEFEKDDNINFIINTLLIHIIHRVLEKYNIKLIVVENYSFGSAGQRMTQIAEITGCIKYKFRKIKQLLIAPSQIKKFGCGIGDLTKGTTKKEVKDYINIMTKNFPCIKRFKTTDDVDSFLLARLGLAVLKKEKCKMGYQNDVVEGIIKKHGKSKRSKS